MSSDPFALGLNESNVSLPESSTDSGASDRMSGTQCYQTNVRYSTDTMTCIAFSNVPCTGCRSSGLLLKTLDGCM
jgi:hypothetical protein